jgi:TonB family protein
VYVNKCHRAIAICLALIAFPMCLTNTAASVEVSPTDSPPPEMRTPVRIDPKHPLTFHSEFYPPQSIRAGEEGTCFVALLVDTDGQVGAVQLLTSTGHPRLDGACIASVVKERMLPAMSNGKPIVGWFTTPISWASSPGKASTRSMAGLAIPRLPEYYELHVGQTFYPTAALQGKEQGICLVHLLVNAKGSVSETQLSKSTGFPDLDRACVDAVTLAEFTPAQTTGAPPVDAWTDIAMFWRLPK